MKLILSGGGSGKDTAELDKKFVSLLDKSKPLLYIPIAINNIKHPYLDCLKWLRSTFDNLGIKEYEMWTEEDLDKLHNFSPKNFAGIYVGGGNTPYLLKKTKETGLWNFIKEAMKFSVPIYGGSAGAVIFGKTIILALVDDKNEVKLEDFTGFDILNGMEITCHYSKSQEQSVKELMKKNNIKKLIALTEKNGLLITNHYIVLIGKEEGFIFENGKIKKIFPGDRIIL